MRDSEILQAAADVLQRKVTVIVRDGLGQTITGDIVQAMMAAGLMTQAIELLREIAAAEQQQKASI